MWTVQEVTSLPSALLSQEQSGLCVTADCKECVCVARLVLAVRRLNQCSLFVHLRVLEGMQSCSAQSIKRTWVANYSDINQLFLRQKTSQTCRWFQLLRREDVPLFFSVLTVNEATDTLHRNNDQCSFSQLFMRHETLYLWGEFKHLQKKPGTKTQNQSVMNLSSDTGTSRGLITCVWGPLRSEPGSVVTRFRYVRRSWWICCLCVCSQFMLFMTLSSSDIKLHFLFLLQ